MAPTDAHEIVRQVLARYVECHHHRDVEGMCSMFAPDGVFFGSGRGESAVGAEELRAVYTRVFSRPHVYDMAFDPPVVGSSGELAWFVATATLSARTAEGVLRSNPYRVSGVVESGPAGSWRLRLWTGCRPVVPPERSA